VDNLWKTYGSVRTKFDARWITSELSTSYPPENLWLSTGKLLTRRAKGLDITPLMCYGYVVSVLWLWKKLSTKTRLPTTTKEIYKIFKSVTCGTTCG
jgi:hypothetical protein